MVKGGGTCIVVMGVSGCGKSSVGRLIAQRLGLEFLEGDEFHPAANVAKMSAGVALDDADRAPWLAAMAEQLAARAAAGRGAVLACSALKRHYRDRLRQGHPGLYFVYLYGDRELIGARLTARQNHYMPATLLDSQLATLEPPQDEPRCIRVAIDRPPEAVAETALAGLCTAGV